MNLAEIEKRKFLLLGRLERLQCEDSYFDFFKSAWPVIEPFTKLKMNWHILYLCEVLQKEVERIAARSPKTTDLAINICPRSLKSMIVSVMLCPWAWTKYPFLRFINSSHNSQLSVKHCVDSRRVIQSPWYQRNWGHRFRMATDQNVKSYFENDKAGLRFATSVGGSPTGHGADVLTADDTNDPKNAESEADREQVIDHWDQALYNRLNDPEVGVRVIVQQRVHESDLTGHVIKTNGDEFRKIIIPINASNPIEPPVLIENYKDGEFFPARFTEKVIAAARRVHGSKGFSNQYEQRVAPASGNIFDRKWFNFYDGEVSGLEKITLSWDMSFKKGPNNSFVVGQAWGKKNGYAYLLHQWREKAGFNESRRAFIAMCVKYPRAVKKLVEDKANGPAIIDSLKAKISGIKAVPVVDSKEARWVAASPIVEDRIVWVPNPATHPWVEEFLVEIESVPASDYDDQADAMVQYLLEEHTESLRNLEQFLKE